MAMQTGVASSKVLILLGAGFNYAEDYLLLLPAILKSSNTFRVEAAKMSTNPEAPTSSQTTVISPDKPESSRLSQPWNEISQLKTEHPVESFNPRQAFTSPDSETPIGNPKAIAMLKKEGHFGIFYDRCNSTRTPELIDINLGNIRTAAFCVIGSILKGKANRLKGIDGIPIANLITLNANHLANGICVMTYMKLRIVNNLDQRVADRYRRSPKLTVPFEVPQPFALAISQLGKIKLSGLVKEAYLTPTVPAGVDTTFGCPANTPWSITAYARAVDFAKKLGMHFSSVDLTVKMGSSWWLYRYAEDEGATNVRLECPYPEENFTEDSAILASLFMVNEKGGFNNPVVNPAHLGNQNYGTMLRNPFRQISRSTFNAIGLF